MPNLHKNPKYYFSSKTTFKNNLDTIHVFVMPNYSIGMHVQDFFEINIITRGNGQHYIEENCIEANVGDVFIIPPNVRHGYTGGEGFDVCHILVSDTFIEKNMTDLQMLPSFFVLFTAEPLMRAKAKQPLHLKLSEEQFEKIRNIIDEALLYDRPNDTADSLLRSSLGMMFITLLCKWYSEKSGNKETDIKGDEAFMRVISMIHERYYEKLTVSKLATAARLSRSAFIRKFNKVCGMPPFEYIIKRRIEAAEYMLLHTGFSISEIAEKTGFYDAAHFSKIFARHKGTLPSDYKKQS